MYRTEENYKNKHHSKYSQGKKKIYYVHRERIVWHLKKRIFGKRKELLKLNNEKIFEVRKKD